MVVSDIGEQWSPNKPPDNTAPMLTNSGASMANAVGMTNGNIMAKVPQDEPVAKEITADNKNATNGSSHAGKPR